MSPSATQIPHASVPEAERVDLAGDRRDRYRQAAALLREWREDESGYDEAIWPYIEEEFQLSEEDSGNAS